MHIHPTPPAPLPVEPERIRRHGQPDDEPSKNAFTPEHFAEAHRRIVEVFPMLRGRPITASFNGMFSFTPDGLPLLGESMDVRGFWVAEAVWITHGGGMGRQVRYDPGQVLYQKGTAATTLQIPRPSAPATASRTRSGAVFGRPPIALDEAAVRALRPGGRLAVISFHSLEDRIVKRFMRDRERGCECPPDFPVCICGKTPELRSTSRKAIRPSAAETAANPRSSSARLRVGVKT